MSRAAALAAPLALAVVPAGGVPGAGPREAAPLRFESGPVEGGDVLLRSAWEYLLRSGTARAFAEDVVREGVPLRAVFVEFPGTSIELDDVRPHLTGAQTAEFQPVGPLGPSIRLNSLYAALPEEDATSAIASSLAHELFGHFLYMRAAERAGLSAYRFHRDDEMRARLIDNIVSLELGKKPGRRVDPGNLAGHYFQLLGHNPYYALGLSSAEMFDPISTYSRRIEELRARLDAVQRDPASAPDAVARLRRCLARLEEAVSPGFAQSRALVISEAGKPFYERLESEVAEFSARLSLSAAHAAPF